MIKYIVINMVFKIEHMCICICVQLTKISEKDKQCNIAIVLRIVRKLFQVFIIYTLYNHALTHANTRTHIHTYIYTHRPYVILYKYTHTYTPYVIYDFSRHQLFPPPLTYHPHVLEYILSPSLICPYSFTISP